jgi:hypothetical protein
LNRANFHKLNSFFLICHPEPLRRRISAYMEIAELGGILRYRSG